MEKKINISVPRLGMQKGSSINQLENSSFTHMKNGQTVDASGNRFTVSNEHSNILANKFKEGYFVVGFKNNIIKNKTYFFLTNPETNVSELGCIINTTSFTESEDTYNEDCKNCQKISKYLSEPLENVDQLSHQEYITLLEDSCNLCLNLSIDNPIKSIEIKIENIGEVMFFTDANGFPKYVELDNLEKYSFIGEESCGEDTEPTCLDCDKLRIFPLYTFPKSMNYERVLGGDLNQGSYEVFFAYSDQLGNTLTDYTSVTNNIIIFDDSNLIQEQEEQNKTTNFGIKVELTNVDQRFRFYKVVVVYKNNTGSPVLYSPGNYSINDNIIIINSNEGEPITQNELFLKRPVVESWNGLTTANGFLFGYGVKTKSPINLQPVVNFMGLSVQWQSFRAKEDLYKNADSYQYLGYNRDENIPIGISFLVGGIETNIFNLIPRPPREEELEIVDENTDINVRSVLNILGDCDGNIRDKRWQFYNTAETTGFCNTGQDIPTVSQQENIFINTLVDIPSVPQGQLTINLEDEDTFIDIQTYLGDNLDTCNSPNPDTNISSICSFFELANLLAFNNIPDQQEFCDSFTLDDEEVQIVEIVGESLNKIPKLLEDYSTIKPSRYCQIYEQDGINSLINEDFSFSYDITKFPFAGENVFIGRTRKRVDTIINTRCNSAEELIKVNLNNLSNSSFNSFYPIDRGSLILADLQTNKTVTAIEGNIVEGLFSGQLHEGALWFKTTIDSRERFFLNISESSSCEVEVISKGITGGTLTVRYGEDKFRKIRLSIFEKCSSTTSIYSEVLDISDSNFIEINNTILSQLSSNTNTFFLAIDFPIIQSQGYGEDWEDIDREVNDPVTSYILKLPCGCFNIVDREEEYSIIEVDYEEIKLKKLQKYVSDCTFQIPILNDCEPNVYEYGEMGYFESTENYPDNQELYDSSTLDIDVTDLPISVRADFEEFYATPNAGKYILNDNTKFHCKPQRFYKLPDNNISPFIGTTQVAINSESIINPLGFRIDPNTVRSFLDVAVKNDLISQEDRDKITAYKVYRGDSTLDRSVISSGITFQSKTYLDQRRQEINYFNYPYNSLGLDKLNSSLELDKTEQDYLFTFHSPETDYFNPQLPSEMKINGYMRGKSTGAFDEVDNHNKWVILGRKAENLATTLAIAEALAETVIAIAQSAEVYRVQFGLANSANPVGIGLNIAVAVLNTVSAVVHKVGRYRYEWLTTFENLGSPRNFAYYYSSYANYNFLNQDNLEESQFRALSSNKYLKSGMLNISDNITGEVTKINHLDRENAAFISSGKDFPIENPSSYQDYDNNSTNGFLSSQPIGSEIGNFIGLSSETNRNVTSPYVSLKNYIPNQYNTINSIKWIDTGYCIDINEIDPCKAAVLGGDTFISRHSFKRKAKLFLSDLFGQADLTPFNYKSYSNYGTARFYIDYKVLSERETGGKLFPDIAYDVQTDSGSSRNGFYFTPPSKFYLYYYGFPSFLTETRINTNFRNARKEPENQFYPQNSDYMAITEEKTVSISRQEKFFYNKSYSTYKFLTNNSLLPSYYEKEVFDKQANNANSVMYSGQDVNENSITEPWLSYRPNDYYVFRADYGELKRLKGIENDQVLGVFENQSVIFRAVDTYVENNESNSEFGTGAIFTQRPRTFTETDLGYLGSQNSEILSCEYGHFIVDSKRGQIFNIKPGAQSMEEISKYANGKPNNMDIWFKEHLPFKIQRDFPTFEDLDNSYNGVGLTMGWDSKFKRVFFTKKDYKIKEGSVITYNKEDNNFTQDAQVYTLQELINNGELDDVSWTIAYKPELGSWESFFDFKPSYYIAHTDYFQTGINQGVDSNKYGLWSHLLTNRSKQVFYGELHDFVVEYVIKNEYTSKRLETIYLWTEAKRYHGLYDYATDDTITFNKAVIYNNRESSGNLELDINTGVLSLLSKYPITSGEAQRILISQNDKKWSFNSFYNRRKSNTNNIPLFKYDENQINKEVNKDAISFYGKKTLERMTGTTFLVRLIQDKTSQYDLELNWASNLEQNER